MGRVSKDERCPHGTLNGYNNYKCRCVDCKAARRKYWMSVTKPQELKKGTRAGGWRPAEPSKGLTRKIHAEMSGEECVCQFCL